MFCTFLTSLVLVVGCGKKTYNDPHKKDLLLYLEITGGISGQLLSIPNSPKNSSFFMLYFFANSTESFVFPTPVGPTIQIIILTLPFLKYYNIFVGFWQWNIRILFVNIV